MRTLSRRLLLVLALFGLLLLATGCGGQKSGGGGGGDDTGTKQAITARINSFKAAVEVYDADGMLDFLARETGAEKILTIAEEGVGSYDKDFNKLEAELREDAGKQRHWRKSPAEGGNGYTLTMELGTITFSSVKESGAYAVVPFAITEAAQDPLIEPITTDRGHMTCEMVKLQGTWRCQKLTIHFYAPDKVASGEMSALTLTSHHGVRSNGSRTKGTRGFSFGRFTFE